VSLDKVLSIGLYYNYFYFIIHVETQTKIELTEIAGVDIDGAWKNGDGHCRSGQWRRKLQGWTLQEWTNTEEVAEVDIAGVDNDGVNW